MIDGDSTILERSFVPKDSLIIKEGDHGDSAYLIQSGMVEVYTENSSKEISLAKLGPGQIFGEMALVFDENRTASVRALDDCNLIVITRRAFQQKLNKTDPAIRSIMKMMTQRVISTNNMLLNKKDTVSDLYETVQIIYQNVLSSLPKNQQDAFQDSVLPKLDDLLKAIHAFEEPGINPP